MKRINPLIMLLLIVSLGFLPTKGFAVEMMTFVFLDQFPENAVPLGFPKERVIQVGAFVKAGDTNVKEVSAVNLQSGVTYKAKLMGELSNIMPTIYLVHPMPAFDPSKHLGIWELRVKDDQGKKYMAKTHNLDKTDTMPYVENLKISGDPLAPTISWNAPNNVPAGCAVRYRVRILKDSDNQFYRSGYLKETTHIIPGGKLYRANIEDLYARVECQCIDSNEPKKPIPLELRSETFLSFKDAFPK